MSEAEKKAAEDVVVEAYTAYAAAFTPSLKTPWSKLPQEHKLAWARAVRVTLQKAVGE